MQEQGTLVFGKTQDWLVARIDDILADRNRKRNHIATRVNAMSRNSFLRSMNRTRDFEESEILSTLKELDVSIKIFLRDHLEKRTNELNLLVSKKNLVDIEQLRAFRIIKLITGRAVGLDEKFLSFLTAGKLHYNIGNYSDAHNYWKQAYKIAIKLNDTEKIFDLILNLCNTHYKRKEYEEILDLLNDGSIVKFVDRPEWMGRISHFKGLCSFGKGDIKSSLRYHKEAFEWYVQTERNDLIGRIEHNIGNLEHLTGDSRQAKLWFERANEHLSNDSVLMRIILNKDLARTLVILNDQCAALRLIEESLLLADGRSEVEHEIIGKLLLVKLDVLKEPTIGENILDIPDLSAEVKSNTAAIMTDIFLNRHDLEAVKKYYSIVRECYMIADYKLGGWF